MYVYVCVCVSVCVCVLAKVGAHVSTSKQKKATHRTTIVQEFTTSKESHKPPTQKAHFPTNKTHPSMNQNFKSTTTKKQTTSASCCAKASSSGFVWQAALNSGLDSDASTSRTALGRGRGYKTITNTQTALLDISSHMTVDVKARTRRIF